MSIPISNLEESLKEIDFLFDQAGIIPRSLNPRQKLASSFASMSSALATLDLTKAELDLVNRFFKTTIRLFIKNFPENIFWDFDYFVFQIVQSGLQNRSEFELYLNKKQNLVEKILEIFGQHSSIRFRYIHDFIYGYDWQKWYKDIRIEINDPSPFGFSFLEYILNRGIEIQSLIEQDDKKYGKIAKSQNRNPFFFRREPEDEISLLQNLAESGDLPIQAWELRAIPDAGKNYSMIRTQRAKSLNLPKNDDPAAHKI
jgi:hypothetical protein